MILEIRSVISVDTEDSFIKYEVYQEMNRIFLNYQLIGSF
jgi:hypothetical protein